MIINLLKSLINYNHPENRSPLVQSLQYLMSKATETLVLGTKAIRYHQ